MIKKFIKLFIGMFVLLVFLGCQIPGVTTEGSLKLTINNGINSKTLVPSLDIEPASYRITGTGPEGAVFDENTTSGEVTIGFLRFGDWTINIEAFNAEGALIATGTANATVHVEAVTPVGITIRLLDGTGTFNLSVSWLQNEVENASISGILKGSSGNNMNLFFNDAEGDPGTENVFADTGNTVPVGYYTLIVKVNDLGALHTANHLALGAVEVVRILKNQTTYGNYNLRGVPGMGKVDVNITQDFNDPIDVSLSAIPFMEEIPTTAEYDSGVYLTLGASVPADDEDAANITYVWYLNGETVGVDDNYTIHMDNSPLSTKINGKYAPGHYRLDVTAFNADGSRAGSAHFEFDVTGNPGQIMPATEGIVNVPDPVLEALLRQHLPDPNAEHIYSTDLETITSLVKEGSAAGRITNLTGIEYCTNLVDLKLNYHDFSDLTPLGALKKLQSLDLRGAGVYKISDVSILSELPALKELHILGNDISDISSLAGKTGLTKLHIGQNPITDISVISELTNLTDLDISGMQLTDINVTANLTKLTRLIINNNSISDLSPIQNLTEIATLDMGTNQISDISALVNLTKLYWLRMPYNLVADMSPLADLPLLEELTIANNRLTDISTVSTLTNLVRLYADSNQLDTISPLANHPKLVHIGLSFNTIADITPLSSIPTLAFLAIRHNNMVIKDDGSQGTINLNVVTELQGRNVFVQYTDGNIIQ